MGSRQSQAEGTSSSTGRNLRRAGVSLLAAGAGLSVSLNAASGNISNAFAGTTVQETATTTVTPAVTPAVEEQHCLVEAADLDGRASWGAAVLKKSHGHEVRVTLQVQTEDSFDPACVPFDTRRRVDAVITLGKKVIGRADNLLYPGDDHGEEVAETAHTTKIGCDDTVHISYDAVSGTELRGHDSPAGRMGEYHFPGAIETAFVTHC